MPRVSDVYKDITTTASIVKEEETIENVRRRLIESPISRSVYVVDNDNKLTGIITVKEILATIGIREGLPLGSTAITLRNLLLHASKEMKAKDFMKPPISIKLDDKFATAIQLMITYSYGEIPVVDTEGRVIGDLNAFEVIQDIVINTDESNDNNDNNENGA